MAQLVQYGTFPLQHIGFLEGAHSIAAELARRGQVAQLVQYGTLPLQERVHPLTHFIFMFSLFYEYSNLEYVRISVKYKVMQAEYGTRILMAASQEYVNTDSTRRLPTRLPTYLHNRRRDAAQLRLRRGASLTAALKVLCVPK